MSFNALPPEVIIDVLEYLYFQRDVPVVGQKAAWTKLLPVSGDEDHDSSSSERPIFYVKSKSSAGFAALLALRGTSKYLSDLCVAWVFRDYHLLPHGDSWQPSEERLCVWQAYSKHIKNIRILHNAQKKFCQEFQHIITTLLPLCTNATSLSLYYERDLSMLPMEETLALFKHAAIQSFGIYSTVILNKEVGEPSWENRMPKSAYTLLNQIFQDTDSAIRLRTLDVVMETLPIDTYQLMQTQLPFLQSLTVRRAFRAPIVDRIWAKNNLWKPNDNLTCLRLIDCSNAHAAQIPHLVRHFKSLRNLMVSTCGDYDDEHLIPGTPRLSGWSKEPEALCQVRRTLDTFHIENMIEWEIRELGVIPTIELVVTLVDESHLIKCLLRDKEIFPGVKVLHSEEGTGIRYTKGHDGRWVNLQGVCERMDIEFLTDADWVRRRYQPEIID